MHIQKHKIIHGCYYVIIEEINLRLLCACPPNIFKFLKKQGFIAALESNGVSYESGPNAILLSDVAIQNNSFSNLIEFPTLQMLYKQGLIIPNHPGNTGEKPLIIGSSEQISAMLGYIYTGNYGLESIEEMTNSGLSKELAEEIMRMKLKFAFGSFRSPDELFDHITLASKPTPIKQDLVIARTNANVFSLEYKGESCEIDLNLSENTAYPSPYLERFFDIPREHFAILHSGDGDGWNPDTPAMSSIIMHHGKIYLIDAEPNIGHVLFNLGISVNEIEGIFNTHAHDDHVGGLASFIKSSHKIRYYSTSFVKETMLKKISILTGIKKSDFSYYFDFVNLELDEWSSINGLKVKPTLTIHPVENVSFLFAALCEDGYKYYSHLADTASFAVMDSMLEPDTSKPGISQKLYDDTKASYLTTVHLKKVDIGGGMIHGSSKDFINDKSDRILLSHISNTITTEDKAIGSTATLGTLDVLIENHNDYLRNIAQELLRSYFTAESPQIFELLNSPIVTFPPQTILLKASGVVDDLYLVLSGDIFCINDQQEILGHASYGTIIGDLAYFSNKPSDITYRSENFVHTLKIPMTLFDNFIKCNGLYERSQANFHKQTFLQNTPLFFNTISSGIKNSLSDKMGSIIIEKDALLPQNTAQNYLCIIESGKVQIVFCDHILYELGAKDFIRPDAFLKHSYSATDVRFVETTTLRTIPLELVRTIPSVIEKLYGKLDRDDTSLLNLQKEIFIQWSNPHIYHLRENNNQHEKLVNFINITFTLCVNRASTAKIIGAFGYLFDLFNNHFNLEESLMVLRNKKLFRKQRKVNKRFMTIMQSHIQTLKHTQNPKPILAHIRIFMNEHLEITTDIKTA